MDEQAPVLGSLESIELVSLFIESFLNGALLFIYAAAAWILLVRNRRNVGKLRRVMFAVATFMLLVSLGHFAIDIQRIADAFTHHHIVSGGATAFFLESNRPSQIAKSVALFAETIAGDAFVVYRLSVVWDRSYRVMTGPVLLLVGYCVAASAFIVSFVKEGAGSEEGGSQQRNWWLATVFTLSLCLNILCTSLIAFRVWAVSRAARAQGPWRFLEIFVQSAAIYLIALAALIATYLARTNFQYILFNVTPPVMAIAFMLIILRVGLEAHCASSGAGTPPRPAALAPDSPVGSKEETQ